MLVNKTFYRINHSKKNNHPSPLKQQNQKKQETKKPKSILKLPSVKNWSGLQFKIYHLGQLIGQGAFSKVYQAVRKTDECKCVVKIIQKDKLNSQERKKAFKRQLQVLNLPKHKNLVNSIDQFQTPEIYGIVMQYFSSECVGQYIKNNRPIQNNLLQSLTKQICEGLLFLHAHGISHRDIKPQNLLINQQGEVKIIDFGFATTSQLTEVVIAGTPQYMAPQLIARKNYDPLKADIWALGIMLYWMALGYFPQDADQKRKKFMANKIQGFNLRFPININPGLQYLIRKMLNPDPKQRIQLKDILQDTWIKPKLFKDQIKRLRQSKNHSVSLSVPL